MVDAKAALPLYFPTLPGRGGLISGSDQLHARPWRFVWNGQCLSAIGVEDRIIAVPNMGNDPFLPGTGHIGPLFYLASLSARGINNACFLGILNGNAVEELIGTGWGSEEHTSELKSLMRTSYAFFCL